MPGASMALLELIEKQAGIGVVDDILALAADRIADVEVEARTAAVKRARSPPWEAPCNGCRDRHRDTRAGRTALEIPPLRQGISFLSFLEPRPTAEKARMAVLREACVHDIPPCSVGDLVKAMAAGAMPRSQGSRLWADNDQRVFTFLGDRRKAPDPVCGSTRPA